MTGKIKSPFSCFIKQIIQLNQQTLFEGSYNIFVSDNLSGKKVTLLCDFFVFTSFQIIPKFVKYGVQMSGKAFETLQQRWQTGAKRFSTYQLILLEWSIMVKQAECSCIVVFTKYDTLIRNTNLKEKSFNNFSEFTFPVKLYEMWRHFIVPLMFAVRVVAPPSLSSYSEFFQDLCVWFCNILQILMGDFNKKRRCRPSPLGWKSPWMSVSRVHVVVFGVGRSLGRTGGPVRGAGVRWCTRQLLVLWGAVCLQRRHGCWWVFAFGRATFAAEGLAFDFPEVVTVVKS